MSSAHHSLNALERLRAAGLRPTRQRLALAKLLLGNGDRHVTAEQLYIEAAAAAMPVSLATVYNTLHQFTEAGLLREVVVEPGRSYFDTNIADHHHFFCSRTGCCKTSRRRRSRSAECRQRRSGPRSGAST